eukprot:scaffold240_cov243-Pinguiococcus_pyrenoidosus.AAC.23
MYARDSTRSLRELPPAARSPARSSSSLALCTMSLIRMDHSQYNVRDLRLSRSWTTAFSFWVAAISTAQAPEAPCVYVVSEAPLKRRTELGGRTPSEKLAPLFHVRAGSARLATRTPPQLRCAIANHRASIAYVTTVWRCAAVPKGTLRGELAAPRVCQMAEVESNRSQGATFPFYHIKTKIFHKVFGLQSRPIFVDIAL